MEEIELTEQLEHVLKSNQEAVKYCLDMIWISHLWDDLIDKDKARTDYEINDAFRICLVETPSNPFFQKHSGFLIPLMQSTILQYEAANKIEQGTKPNKEAAFWLRNGVLNIVGACISIVGGMTWYREVAADFYLFLWEDYQNLFKTFKEEFPDG